MLKFIESSRKIRCLDLTKIVKEKEDFFYMTFSDLRGHVIHIL